MTILVENFHSLDPRWWKHNRNYTHILWVMFHAHWALYQADCPLLSAAFQPKCWMVLMNLHQSKAAIALQCKSNVALNSCLARSLLRVFVLFEEEIAVLWIDWCHRYWKGDSALRPFCFSTTGEILGKSAMFGNTQKRMKGCMCELFRVSFCVGYEWVAYWERCGTANAHAPILSFSHWPRKMQIYQNNSLHGEKKRGIATRMYDSLPLTSDFLIYSTSDIT